METTPKVSVNQYNPAWRLVVAGAATLALTGASSPPPIEAAPTAQILSPYSESKTVESVNNNVTITPAMLVNEQLATSTHAHTKPHHLTPQELAKIEITPLLYKKITKIGLCEQPKPIHVKKKVWKDRKHYHFKSVPEQIVNWHQNGQRSPGGLGVLAGNWYTFGGYSHFGNQAKASPEEQMVTEWHLLRLQTHWVQLAKPLPDEPMPDQRYCQKGGY